MHADEDLWLAHPSAAAAVNAARGLPAPAAAAPAPLPPVKGLGGSGVALLPVHGVLAPRGPVVNDRVALDEFTAGFKAAVARPGVTTVVLDISSPGGPVEGVAEAAEVVFRARARKRVIAVVSGQAAAGAYWLSSAASEVVIDATATVGGVGVVATLIDTKGLDQRLGIRRLEIVSSQSSRKRPDPTTEGGRDLLQRRVDDVAEVFVQAVARNRGVDRATVLSGFGQGDMLVGERAVRAGLADRLGSLRGLLSELSQRAQGESKMTTPTQKPALANVTLEQLRAERPDLVQAIERQVRERTTAPAAASGAAHDDEAEFERMVERAAEQAR